MGRRVVERIDLQILAGRRGLALVGSAAIPRPAAAVGFDGFVFDRHAVRSPDGATVQIGRHDETMLAVASVDWADLPVEWAVLSSRRGDDVMGLGDDDLATTSDTAIDERFRIDTDEADALSAIIDAPLRAWLLATDDGYGPIHLVLDGGDADDDEAPPTPMVHLARDVVDETEILDTLGLVIEARSELSHRAV